MKLDARFPIVLLCAGILAAWALLPAATRADEARSQAQVTQRDPCAAKGQNPCNPCAAKNPCNPCAGKNPCNPCAGKNPCNPCGGANPCNPCGARKVSASQFVRPGGKTSPILSTKQIAYGKQLWNDTRLSTNGLSCNSCHANNAALNATFAKPYPH